MPEAPRSPEEQKRIKRELIELVAGTARVQELIAGPHEPSETSKEKTTEITDYANVATDEELEVQETKALKAFMDICYPNEEGEPIKLSVSDALAGQKAISESLQDYMRRVSAQTLNLTNPAEQKALRDALDAGRAAAELEFHSPESTPRSTTQSPRAAQSTPATTLRPASPKSTITYPRSGASTTRSSVPPLDMGEVRRRTDALSSRRGPTTPPNLPRDETTGTLPGASSRGGTPETSPRNTERQHEDGVNVLVMDEEREEGILNTILQNSFKEKRDFSSADKHRQAYEILTSAITQQLEKGDLHNLPPMRSDKYTEYKTEDGGSLKQTIKNDVVDFKPEGEFSGIVRIQRRGANGKLDKNNVDIIEYHEGKVVGVVGALEGTSRVDLNEYVRQMRGNNGITVYNQRPTGIDVAHKSNVSPSATPLSTPFSRGSSRRGLSPK